MGLIKSAVFTSLGIAGLGYKDIEEDIGEMHV